MMETDDHTEMLAVSFNNKQGIWDGYHFTRPDLIDLQQNNAHIFRVVERKIYGHSIHKGACLEKVCFVSERGTMGNRWHQQGKVALPEGVSFDYFAEVIRRAILDSRWGYGQIVITPYGGDRWTNYCTKFRSKPLHEVEYDECIDVLSFRDNLPTPEHYVRQAVRLVRHCFVNQPCSSDFDDEVQ